MESKYSDDYLRELMSDDKHDDESEDTWQEGDESFPDRGDSLTPTEDDMKVMEETMKQGVRTLNKSKTSEEPPIDYEDNLAKMQTMVMGLYKQNEELQNTIDTLEADKTNLNNDIKQLEDTFDAEILAITTEAENQAKFQVDKAMEEYDKEIKTNIIAAKNSLEQKHAANVKAAVKKECDTYKYIVFVIFACLAAGITGKLFITILKTIHRAYKNRNKAKPFRPQLKDRLRSKFPFLKRVLPR